MVQKQHAYNVYLCCACEQTSINPQVQWQQELTLCLRIDHIVACVMATMYHYCPWLATAALMAARQLTTADVYLRQQQAPTPFVTKAAGLYNTKPAVCTV